MSKVVSKCGCEFGNNHVVFDKARSTGCENNPMTEAASIECICGNIFLMTTLVYLFPHCKMTYTVTPCSADDYNYIVRTGINYYKLY